MALPAHVPTFAELPVVEDAPPHSSWGVFGRDDQIGTLNFLTAERRLAGAQTVKRGAANVEQDGKTSTRGGDGGPGG